MVNIGADSAHLNFCRDLVEPCGTSLTQIGNFGPAGSPATQCKPLTKSFTKVDPEYKFGKNAKSGKP